MVSPVCSTADSSGKVFLRMAMAAVTLADGWEALSVVYDEAPFHLMSLPPAWSDAELKRRGAA
jgi:hypothetical protein